MLLAYRLDKPVYINKITTEITKLIQSYQKNNKLDNALLVIDIKLLQDNITITALPSTDTNVH